MAENTEQPGSWDAAMHAFALALVSATSVGDVLTIAADHLPRLLRDGDRIRVHGTADLPERFRQSSPGPESGCIPLRAGGRVVGAIVAVEDAGVGTPVGLGAEGYAHVTELLEAALARLEAVGARQARALKEAAQLKFDVVSMLSHEMRTPLTSIKGYASALLLDDVSWDAASSVEFLQSIEAEADHLTKLIADILEAAAMEAGELRLDLEPILVSRIAKRVIDKLAIHGAGHRFVLMFPPDFPVVEADAHRIEQVLTNLVDNAVKYSPDGGMVLVRGEMSAREVTVSVVDQGMGIAPEHLNKLFERFFRAVPDHRRRIVGTGLGLPIADAIVRAHGGRIWASSVVGGGTTLSFSLPHPRPSSGHVSS
jgi:signal transduction histidine kinase